MNLENKEEEFNQEELQKKVMEMLGGDCSVGPFRKVSGELLAVAHRTTGDGAEEQHEHFHVQSDGSRAYQTTFDYVGEFEQGKALVKKHGEEFFIRPNGTKLE
ncbi:MAG: hypothetical protein KJI71_02300 [Patescibacteria group bacterium]|nr:hypothetical protein [Patescibacteria group bacterium]